jgi:antitoxin (DNA-binding transcriptional repressor) of toxin-antitoxin stability system
MRSVALKALKNKLSEYIRLASAGETVLVTDQDRIVAEIVPPQPGHQATSHDEFIARGVREGWLTPATAPPGAPMPPRNPIMSFEELLADLERDRAER